MNPRVFISHASKDKDRFVLDFARQLREQGVDAWLDKWEIGPGDSLVQRIFDEGIGKAQAVIVVVSKFSVDRPWVRAELDVSVVKKIEQQLTLIPVVIDAYSVPRCQDHLGAKIRWISAEIDGSNLVARLSL